MLCRPKSPGNLGAVARAMMTMGLDSLTLVAPIARADHPDAVERACAAAPVLARARVVPTLADALAECTWVVGASARDRAAGPPAHDVHEAASQTARRGADGGRVAWVFGNERDGLSNEELRACQIRARIPTADSLSSLNLAAAVQVACYEIYRASQAWSAPPRPAPSAAPPAPRAALRSVADRLHRALVAVGRYSEQDGRTVAAERRFLRTLDRLGPSDEEVRAIHAMLKWLGH